MAHDRSSSRTLSLPARPDFEKLKKDAKQLLRGFRSGNPDAVAVVHQFHPRPAEFTGVRDAQLALARQYGHPDWESLREAVALARLRARSPDERAELFTRDGCLRYNGDDAAFRYRRAAQMLEQEPRLAYVSLYSALVAGNLDAVRRKLDDGLETGINAPGGPFMRPPMLYLTYSRVPADPEQVLAIMRLLLDKGADPDSHVMLDEGSNRFSAMTGAMGEGERGPVSCVPHACADELVTLLLDAGANPNEAQGLYNTQFTDSIDKWLPLLIRYGLNKDHKAWGDFTTFDYFVAQAAEHGKFERVKLLVEHGADPNAVNRYNGHTCHSLALLRGHEEMAQWLVEKGATPRPLTPQDRFMIACRKSDRDGIEALLEQHPQLRHDADLPRGAMHFGIDLVVWLVERGFDINARSRDGRTLLIAFALWNDVDAVEALLAHGADPDLTDLHFGATPLGFALHHRHWKVIEHLVGIANSIFDVVRVPHLQRATYILERDPSQAKRRTPMGNAPLHLVSQVRDLEPDIDDSAAMIDLLLAHGADIEAKNNEGLTPSQWYRKLGVDDMVELLQERGAVLAR